MCLIRKNESFKGDNEVDKVFLGGNVYGINDFDKHFLSRFFIKKKGDKMP